MHPPDSVLNYLQLLCDYYDVRSARCDTSRRDVVQSVPCSSCEAAYDCSPTPAGRTYYSRKERPLVVYCISISSTKRWRKVRVCMPKDRRSKTRKRVYRCVADIMLCQMPVGYHLCWSTMVSIYHEFVSQYLSAHPSTKFCFLYHQLLERLLLYFFSPGNLASITSCMVRFCQISSGSHPILALSPKPPNQ